MLHQAKETIAEYLVRLGPRNWLFQSSFKALAALRGFKIESSPEHITVEKADRTVILGCDQFIFVPFIVNNYDLYFSTIESKISNGRRVLDFSTPGLHRYSQRNVAFYFPSIPEDDVMGAYTASYLPQKGDIVWDAGAHAGATSFFLTQLIGPTGKVYAFEPDEVNYGYLLRNINEHSLLNVVPVKKALAGKTGDAVFSMEGSLGSGVADCLPHVEAYQLKTVQAVTIRDACEQLGEVPKYIKMDIEGAEVEAIEGSLEFIRKQKIHFVLESNHRANGEMTYKALDRLFAKIGYDVWSSDKFGQMFTWARPPAR